MAETEYLYCEKCRKTKLSKYFYATHNLQKYPSGRLNQCRDCLTMHVDNWDPDTYLWILEEADVPYIPSEWAKLMRKYAADPEKLTGSSILGRYLGKMRLKAHRDYRWADTEFIQKLEEQKIIDTMKSANKYTAVEIAEIVEDSKKIELPERPPEPEPEPEPPSSPSFGYELKKEEEENNELYKDVTEEERMYLRVKWGKNYKIDEWIQLEKLYNDMMESYDIQTAGHIDTLKFICKTSLKANQLLDLGDVDGAQKMLRAYDSLMKSGRFTEAQHKSEKGEAVDSISEIVLLCEREGFIPRFYDDKPKDKVDRVLEDMKQYTRTLVTDELGLGNMFERAIKALGEESARKATIDDEDEREEETLERQLFSPEPESQPRANDLIELMELEDLDSIADQDLLSGDEDE